jgi:hypothetical protein
MLDAGKNREIKSHRDLIVWQKAMELAVLIYHTSKSFQKKRPMD